MGLGLKVYDAYRPRRATEALVEWARSIGRGDLVGPYIAARSYHNSGQAVDLTLVSLPAGQELDMGTPYDFSGPQSGLSDRRVSEEARKNRALLVGAMTRGGFRPYHKEWWHYTLANEPFPDTYFNFPVR